MLLGQRTTPDMNRQYGRLLTPFFVTPQAENSLHIPQIILILRFHTASVTSSHSFQLRFSHGISSSFEIHEAVSMLVTLHQAESQSGSTNRTVFINPFSTV